jgi:hypothetical protein
VLDGAMVGSMSGLEPKPSKRRLSWRVELLALRFVLG